MVEVKTLQIGFFNGASVALYIVNKIFININCIYNITTVNNNEKLLVKKKKRMDVQCS